MHENAAFVRRKPECRFYAIGWSGIPWGGAGIPAYTGRAANVTELYALDPATRLWVLVFRQTLPYFWPGDVLSLNPGNPDSQMYAILDRLDQFRDQAKGGALTFKLLWPDDFNRWSQTSNPVAAVPGKVAGYAPLAMRHTGENFGGLNRFAATPPECLLTGDTDGTTYFYAIGTFATWNGGIPGWDPAIPVSKVELFVRNRTAAPQTHWL